MKTKDHLENPLEMIEVMERKDRFQQNKIHNYPLQTELMKIFSFV
jgi:hypothetical protein